MKNRVQLSPLGDEKEGGEAPAEQNEATQNVEETETPDTEEEGNDNTGE